MPIHDFRCNECRYVHAELVKWDEESHTCPECGNTSTRVFLTAPKLDWLRMGAQANASPEFKAKWDRVHQKQTAKEKAFEKEHGEGEYFNRAPGG